MRSHRFDLGILLPNSFRSAWMLRRGGTKNRLGYAREYRTLLLTHRIHAIKKTPEQALLDACREEARSFIRAGKEKEGWQLATVEPSAPIHPARLKPFLFRRRDYQPVPTIDYYLALAHHLGAPATSHKQMQLAITPEEQSEAQAALALRGISPTDNLVTIVPGANFGSSKCWPPERFAQVADRLMDRQSHANAHVILATSPAELPIADAILAASLLCPNGKGIGRLHTTATMNDGEPLSIGALKHIVKRSMLMVCNDTGPRHFAAAFNIPTVTLFGPTDPVWAETFSKNERIVRIDVPCGPCQLKKCPIDHRCMKGLTTELVMQAITALIQPAEPAPEPDIDPRTLNDAPT
jgi:heptosyltransferase-2